jgi:hypothetical protein
MHTVALDGVFSVAGDKPRFYQLPGPSDEEVCHIVEATANATLKMLKTRGFVGESEDDHLDPSCLDEVFQSSEQLAAAVSASTSMRVAFGERQGQAVRRIGRFQDFAVESAELIGRRCASAGGFTIHANRFIAMNDRRGLEKLLAYGARGSFSNQRLSLADADDPDGDLVYSLKAPWRDGAEAILLSPTDAIESL